MVPEMTVYVPTITEHSRHINISAADSVGGAHTFSYQNDADITNYFFTTPEYTESSSVAINYTAPHEVQATSISLWQFIVWGILGTILGVLGLLGNTLSIVVLHRRQMRSSTSYYLLSLAIYDNGILLGMIVYFCLPALVPYAAFMSDYNSFFAIALPVGYPLSLSAQMGSIYTCVGFTVERFIAVCRPLHAANTCTKSRTVRAIVLIFFWSVAYNIPRFFHYRVIYPDHSSSLPPKLASSLNMSSNVLGDELLDERYDLVNTTSSYLSNISHQRTFTDIISNISNSKVGHLLTDTLQNVSTSTHLPLPPVRKKISFDETEFGSDPTFKHVYLIYFQLFFMFLLPFLIILVMNIGLIRAVRGSKSMHQSMCATARKEHNLTVMLIAVIVVFLVCQFPTIVDNILNAVLGKAKLKPNFAYQCFWVLTTFMVEINAASNFLLYCFFGKKFRLMLLSILGIKRKQHHVAYRSTVSKTRTNGTRTYEMEVSVM